MSGTHAQPYMLRRLSIVCYTSIAETKVQCALLATQPSNTVTAKGCTCTGPPVPSCIFKLASARSSLYQLSRLPDSCMHRHPNNIFQVLGSGKLVGSMGRSPSSHLWKGGSLPVGPGTAHTLLTLSYTRACCTQKV